MYGRRARLGIIIPSSTTIEPEYYSILPAGVSLHIARMRLDDTATVETLREMHTDVRRCGSLLATADVDVVGFVCTVGSLLDGPDTARRIVEKLTEQTGVASVATAGAVDRALEALDVDLVVITTPYIDSLNELEREYFEALGYDVVDIEGLSLDRDTEMGRQVPMTAYRKAREIDSEQADCVFVSCTNYRTFEVIEPLERDLGKPVVTSNQATLWEMLTRVGVDPTALELGKLFTHSPR